MEKNSKLKILKCTALICLIFIVNCIQPYEKTVPEAIVLVDTAKLYGYWEHKGIGYSSFRNNEPNFDNIYGKDKGIQWIFKEDSIFITDYPVQLAGKRHFIIKQDSIIFESIYFSPNRNKVTFSGDTLILTGRNNKGIDTITNYFLKTKHKKTELDFLISEKINWSLFTNQILINANQKDLKDSLFPYIPYLDLRESNSSNFSTSQDSLFYRDTLGNHSFRFRIDSDLDGLNLIYLNDTGIERVLFFRQKTKHNKS